MESHGGNTLEDPFLIKSGPGTWPGRTELCGRCLGGPSLEMDGRWGQWGSEGEDFLREEGHREMVEATHDQLPWIPHFAPSCSGEQSIFQTSVGVIWMIPRLIKPLIWCLSPTCPPFSLPPHPHHTALKMLSCLRRRLGFLSHFGVCHAVETDRAEIHTVEGSHAWFQRKLTY